MGPAGSGHGGSRNPKKGRFAPGSDVAVAPSKAMREARAKRKLDERLEFLSNASPGT